MVLKYSSKYLFKNNKCKKQMIDILIRFLVIFVMSFLFGIERQLANKPIGFGTFIFVATGSCALGILASLIAPDNTITIIGGVVTGIGFLGAGALIRTTDKIFGFTTAASIWIFSIIGLTIGMGEYLIGILTYTTVWVVVIIDKTLELNGIGSYQRKVTIRTTKIVGKEEIINIFRKHKWRLISFKMNKEKNISRVVYLINMPRSYVSQLRKRLEDKSWVDYFSIE